jgi:hypothetical protein
VEVLGTLDTLRVSRFLNSVGNCHRKLKIKS